MTEGWYYLHTNGELIYKRDLDGTVADLRESDFVRGIWPCDPTNRAHAWRTCVEGLAAGARPERVLELAEKWGCDDVDAAHYARLEGVNLFRDGNAWCAARLDFVNPQESPCRYGETCLEAMSKLALELGYKPSKMWGATFKDLLKVSPQVTA